MTTSNLRPGSFERLALALVGLLVAISVAGFRGSPQPRVLLLGRLHDPMFVEACQCSSLRIDMPLVGGSGLVSGGAGLLNRTGFAVVTGRVHPNAGRRSGAWIEVDSLTAFESISASPRGLLGSLQRHPLIAMAILVILTVYGWEFVSFVFSGMVAAVHLWITAVALNLAAIHAGLGLPDLSWTLIMTTAGLAGWKVSERFDQVMQGNAKSGAASLMIALLFGQEAGIPVLIAGVIVPMLSQRLALLFITLAMVAATLQLSDAVVRTMAGVIFVAACFDRIRNRTSEARHVSSSVT